MSRSATPKERLFKNKILESLTRTHIAVPLTIFYGAAAGIIIYTLNNYLFSSGQIALTFLGGFFFFTLVEYIVHRYAFHIAPTTPLREKMAYAFHGVHHDFPTDKTRLAMPPVASVTLATTIIVIFRLVLGPTGFPFGAGFIAGYASYLVVHYSVHAFRPPKNFLKFLWKHHQIHHYVDNTVAFGVSSPFWDVIFRTMPKKNKQV